MSNQLEQLFETTKQLAEQIEEAEEEQLLNLINNRDVVLSNLQSQAKVTEKDKQILKEICSFDPIILAKMNGLKDEASQGLDKIKRSRIQKDVYEQSYSAESYFIDKKK